MAWLDFLKLGQNLKENTPTVKATPQQIEVLQYDNDGNVDYAKTLNARQNTIPLNFNERMLGRLMSIDEQKIDPETNKTELVTHTNFKPGLLNDIGAGYRENRTTPISLDNFGQNTLEDGRNKGFAYKFGEGLGSFARFADSPLGRGLLMAGIVGGAGGSGLQALAYGGGAGLLNQQSRMKDQLYRNALEQQGVDTSNIRGFVGDDAFKNYSLSNYRNRNLDVKMHLGTLSDNTKRAQLINTMLNTGELDPVQAVQLLGDYGIDVTELDTSNQTKLLPYKQFAIQTNAVSNAKRANAYANYMSDRTFNNETANADLAEYLEIVNSNNRGQIEYARNSFIKRYGKDPDKLIKM